MTLHEDDGDGLLAEFDRVQLSSNGVPDPRRRADRQRALALLQTLLDDVLEPDAVVVSPLGPEWTEVFEVCPRRQVETERLTAYGWLPLDRLLDRRGRRHRQPRRWAIVEEGRVLAGLRLVDGPADRVSTVLDRCRERSEVRLCDVLELRALQRSGERFPAGAAALRVAAEIESGLGGRLLAPWASGRSAVAPAPIPGGSRGPVVAISGVDGSGKSTLRAAVADNLDRAGIRVSTVWVRPGMGLGWLTSLASWGKRLLRQDARPGLRAMADPGAARPASRRGAVGWIWAFLVTVSFLVGVWRQHARSRGVVLYDRHLVDALATLDFAYDGVGLRVQRRLIRALLPRADVRIYLDVPAEVSVARKPDDLLGEHAVRQQLAGYANWLDRLPHATRMAATLSTDELTHRVLELTTAALTNGHKGTPRG